MKPPLSESLTGLRVVDLTRNLAGPYCTMVLADLGADVVKIESPTGGDDSRSWQPPGWNGQSATFLSANRNKRSLALDLDTDAGRQLVRELAAGADVVVESFRPGSLRARGLDYESLRALNPAVIYCSITGYGNRGPESGRPGYDPVVQAGTGIMELTGYPDGPPARLGIGAVDLGTALWAAIGIQAALANRASHGEGALIEASLFETSAWWLSYHLIGYLGTGATPQRQGTGTPFIARTRCSQQRKATSSSARETTAYFTRWPMNSACPNCGTTPATAPTRRESPTRPACAPQSKKRSSATPQQHGRRASTAVPSRAARSAPSPTSRQTRNLLPLSS